jgi:uncharacterized protein (DUF1499 family)
MKTRITGPDGRRARAVALLPRIALGTGAGFAIAALLAGPMYRMQLVSLGAAFKVLRWTTYGAIAGAAVAVLAWVLVAATGMAKGRSVAAVALALNALVAAPPLVLYWRALHLPPIHDISTDTRDPPQFVAVLPLRRGASNGVEFDPGTAALQKRGYPDIAPLRLDRPPAQVFARAERIAQAMGWQIDAVAPAALRIEATDTTLFFGFKDDIVIRVRAQGQSSIVDVRSLSRIGRSDIGTNAGRVRKFLARLAGD